MITFSKKRIFKVFKWSAYVFLLFLLVLSILFALIQTDQGKRVLANRISGLISSEPDFKIRIEGLEGFLPFDLSITHVAVSDRVGEYLTLDDLSFRWSPLSFLKKPIRINNLTIADIQLNRLPVSQKPKKKTDKFNLPAWPPPIPPIIVEKIEFDKIRLDKQVMGESASFNFNGAVSSTEIDHLTKGEFILGRTDKPGTQVNFNFELKGKEPELILKAKVEEPKAGLIHLFSGLKEVGKIKATLEGQGPLSLWQGHLQASAEKIAQVETELELAFQKKLKLKSKGRLTLDDSVVPPSLSPLLDNNRADFIIDLGYKAKDQLTAEKIELKTTRLHFNTQGLMDMKDQRLKGEYALYLPDLSVINQTMKTTMKGLMDIKGRISGPLDHPQIKMTTRAADIQYQDIKATEVMLDILIQDQQGWPHTLNDLMIKVEGSIKGLHDQTSRDFLPADPYRWSLETVIKKPTPNVITINDLAFKSREVGLNFSGSIDTEKSILKGKALLNIPELGLWAKTIGKKFKGEVFLENDLEAEFKTGKLWASIKGTTRNFGGLDPELDKLLKQQTEISTQLNLVNAEKMKISALNIRNPWMVMTGEGVVSLTNSAIEANASLTLPDLDVFSSLINSPLKGKLAINSIIKGPFQDLNIQTEARGSQITYFGRTIRQLDLSLLTKNIIRHPEGLFTLELYEGENNLRTTSDYSLKGSRLALSDLVISAEGGEIKGGLDLDFKGPAIKGELRSQGIDLSSLSDILGEPIAGRLEVDAVLQNQDKGQEVILILNGHKLSTKFGNAANLELRASLADLFHHPTGNIDAAVKDFQQNDLRLDLLSLQAEGDISKNDFGIQAKGDYHGPFEIITKGSIDRTSAEERLNLTQFQGRFQKNDVTLVQDLILLTSKNQYELKPVQLRLGAGTLKAFGQFSPDHLSGEAVLQDMPMKILSLAGIPEFQGSASGNLSLSGRPNQPGADLRLQLKELRLEDTSYMNLPPAETELEITYRNQRLHASLLGKGLSDKPLRADIVIPVHISLSPMEFITESTEKISGKVAAEFDLSRFPAFFYLEDQILTGRLMADIDVSGSLKKPSLNGDLLIKNGSYEHLRQGVLLKDLQLEARMVNDRILLEKIAANDGEQGKMSAKGRIDLNREKGFPLEIELQLNNSTLVRRDDLTATADGKLTFSGNKDEALLSGRVTIGPAELRLPERLPPEVPDLKVTEINSPNQKAVSEEKQAKKKKTKINLDLDLDFPGRTFVRGRGLDSEWQGKLRLSGTTEKPLITGGLSVIRGRYEFFGKPFSLTRGVLTLTGASPPSPDFDILAEHKQPDLITRIGVKGNPSSLDIELTSEPSLPSDEIMSRLLFGRNASAITPFQALRLAAALKTMSEGGGGSMFDFMDNTRRLIGLDQLSLTQSEDKESTPSVSAGKYLKENVYLQVEKGLSSEGDKLSVEVQVTPNISVESEAGRDGQGGIGLNWEWTY